MIRHKIQTFFTNTHNTIGNCPGLLSSPPFPCHADASHLKPPVPPLQTDSPTASLPLGTREAGGLATAGWGGCPSAPPASRSPQASQALTHPPPGAFSAASGRLPISLPPSLSAGGCRGARQLPSTSVPFAASAVAALASEEGGRWGREVTSPSNRFRHLPSQEACSPKRRTLPVWGRVRGGGAFSEAGLGGSRKATCSPL